MALPREQELEDQVELMRQQLAELTGTSQELGALMALRHGMTQTMATMLLILVKRAPAVISQSTFHSVMYGDRTDGGPDPKIFAVRVSRLRGILKELERKGHGQTGKIDTVWHAGYRASPQLVEWVKELFKKSIPQEH